MSVDNSKKISRILNMKPQRTICLMLSMMMFFCVLPGCRAESSISVASYESSMTTQTQKTTLQETPEPDTVEPVVEEQPETLKARDMGLIPAEWDDDLSVEADSIN